MKIPEQPDDFNPLTLVLKLIPNKDPITLTTGIVDSIASALSLGKIECDNREQVIDCLKVMHEMEIISLIEKKENLSTTYLIGNLYNGK